MRETGSEQRKSGEREETESVRERKRKRERERGRTGRRPGERRERLGNGDYKAEII